MKFIVEYRDSQQKRRTVYLDATNEGDVPTKLEKTEKYYRSILSIKLKEEGKKP